MFFDCILIRTCSLVCYVLSIISDLFSCISSLGEREERWSHEHVIQDNWPLFVSCICTRRDVSHTVWPDCVGVAAWGVLGGGEARGVGQGIGGFWLDIFTERRPVKVLSTFIFSFLYFGSLPLTIILTLISSFSGLLFGRINPSGISSSFPLQFNISSHRSLLYCAPGWRLTKHVSKSLLIDLKMCLMRNSFVSIGICDNVTSE